MSIKLYPYFLNTNTENSVHWRYYGSALLPEIWYLVNSLDEMAHRWLGDLPQDAFHTRCLATTYADYLRDLHQRCVVDPLFSVDVLGYSTVISNHQGPPTARSPSSACTPPDNQRQQHPEEPSAIPINPLQPDLAFASRLGESNPAPHWSFPHENLSPANARTFLDETSLAGPSARPATTPSLSCPDGGPPADELSTISYLMDQRFMDMDRVISLDDMMFSKSMMSPMNGARTGNISRNNRPA